MVPRASGRWQLALLGLFAGALGAPAIARAQISPSGPQFQINSSTTGYQFSPAVASNGQGNFVVVWASYASTGTDSDLSSIQGRRFAADGSPIGGEFQVNALTTGPQWEPAVAMNDAGNFVVAWNSVYAAGGIPEDGIRGRRFSSDGVPLAAEFQVNSETVGDQFFPSVAMNDAGGFVVAWMSDPPGGDGDGSSIQAQLYDAEGNPAGSEFRVNSYQTGFQYLPAVAMDGQGGFVVVWDSDGSPSDYDRDGSSIQARRYSSNGNAIGDQFLVNTPNFINHTLNAKGSQINSSIAMTSDGRFVISWQSEWGESASPVEGLSIHSRRFASDGSAIGNQFQVNSYTPNSQTYPGAAIDEAGNFLIVWSSNGSGEGDVDGMSVHGRRYAWDGGSIDVEFQVNSYTTSHQKYPSAAMDSAGNFLVVWESDGSSGNDASLWSIQGQLYDALFRDGFESGDLARWSASQP